MNIEQPLAGMTWGELRTFVRLGASYPDEEEVFFEHDDNLQIVSMLIIGFDPARLH